MCIRNQEKIMVEIKEIQVPGYQKVIEGIDAPSGLHCFIAIHNSTLGPALGGTRIFPYQSKEAALNDALRLAKGMTYKSAVAENGFGGGKSVIIADPKKDKTERLLHSFGEVINTLKGLYIAAEDIGTNTDDMVTIRKKTPFVAALPTDKSSGDPSRFTAWGVYRGIQAAAKFLWNSTSLKGKKIAIQGLGSVGAKLANTLFWEGADLIISDIDESKLHDLSVLYGAEIEQDVFSVKCDILAPCALGGIINDKTIPCLQCKAIAGAANNQLLEPKHADELMKRGILYVPDYVINAGGIINAALEFDPNGYNPKVARDKVNHIYDILLSIFEKGKKEGRSTSEIADEMALYNIQHLVGKRNSPILFK